MSWGNYTTLLRFLLVALLLFALSLAVALSFIDYQQFSDQLLLWVNKQAWKTYFEQQVFPPKRFFYTKIVYWLLQPILWLGVYWGYQNAPRFSQRIYYFNQKTKQLFRQLFIAKIYLQERWVVGLLTIAFLVRIAFQNYQYELQYDEAWTYNHFVSKGVLVSLISPNNNHIFYTLWASLLEYTGLPGKYVMRLPVVITGALLGLTFYGVVRQWFGAKLAFFATALLWSSPAVVFYSMYGRGYIFQLFWGWVALVAMLKIIENNANTKKYYWTIWVIAHVLGLYSVPTHLYLWVALSGVLLLAICTEKVSSFWYWLRANLWITLLSSLLFLPLLLTNGMTALWQAASGVTVSGESFWNYKNRVADWLLVGGGRGTIVYPFYGVLFLASMAGLGYYYQQKNKQLFYLSLTTVVLLLLPTLVGAVVGTQTPYRAWCFVAVFIVLLLPLWGNILLEHQWGKYGVTAISISAVVCSLWRSEVHYFTHWSQQLDRTAPEVAAVLLEHQVDTCYFFSNYDKPLLQYYYLQAGKSLTAPMVFVASKDYAPFEQANQRYQAVLWDKEDYKYSAAEVAWLERYYPVVWYQNERIVIRAAR